MGEEKRNENYLLNIWFNSMFMQCDEKNKENVTFVEGKKIKNMEMTS